MIRRTLPTSGPTRRLAAIAFSLALCTTALAACDTSSLVADGVVASPEGARLAKVEITVYSDDEPVAVATTTSNLAGEWSLRSSQVTPGRYRVKVGDEWWSQADSWTGAASVLLDPADPPTLETVVVSATRLTGSVVGPGLAPTAGWLVAAVDGDGAMVSSIATDASGAFRLPLVSGAGSYRIVLRNPDTGSVVPVGGAASPERFTVGAGEERRVGAVDAATATPVGPVTTAETSTGPYEVTSTTVGPVNGFGGGTIYSPVSRMHAPYGAVVVAPGFLSSQSTVSWYGPRLASQGFIVFTIDTNAPGDFPPSRANQLLAALDWLATSSPVADVVDPTRSAVMGWSMGGGGALNAGLLRPSLRAVVALAPWEPRLDYSAMQVPTLIVGCESDAIAPVAQHARPMYESLGASLPNGYIELADADHGCVTSSNRTAAHRTVIARQSLGFLHRYVNGDERYATVVCPPPAAGGLLSDSRSSCPF